MSEVTDILKGLSDADLKTAVLEFSQREVNGVLPNPRGKLAELQRQMQKTRGRNTSDARYDAAFEICMLAAFKWAGVAN